MIGIIQTTIEVNYKSVLGRYMENSQLNFIDTANAVLRGKYIH